MVDIGLSIEISFYTFKKNNGKNVNKVLKKKSDKKVDNCVYFFLTLNYTRCPIKITRNFPFFFF